MTKPASMTQRLAEAEAMLDALRRQEVDAIVGRDDVMLLRLREAEAALRASETRYRTLLGSIDQGFCVIEVIFDDTGTATDYRFLETNAAFIQQSGIASPIGRRIRTIVPNHEEHWFQIYGEVATTGEPVRFEQAAEALGRVYDVYAFRVDDPSQRRVAVLFSDITVRMKADQLRRASERRHTFLLELSDSLRPLADPLAIQTEAARVLGQHLDASRVHYSEVPPEGNHTLVRADYHDGAMGRHRLDLYGTTVMEGLAAGCTITVADVQNDPRLGAREKERAALENVAAYIVVPLRKEGRAVAVLMVHHVKPHRWTEEEIGLIEETADRTWASVQRATAEAALRHANRRLQSTLDSISDGVLVLDRGWRFRYFSETGARMLGMRSEQLLGQCVWDVFPQAKDSRFFKECDRAVATRQPTHFEEYYAAPLNKWLECRCYPADEGLTVYFTDITERKQVEQALRRSEERWNAAIDHFGEGAIIATECEQVVYWNPAARRMHGFTHVDEGLGALEDTPNTFELWTPDGRRRLTLDEWPMRRIKRGEPVDHMELRLRRPDQGWERFVSYSGAMVETPTAGERLIFLSVFDLTEQRRAEEALRASEERFRQLADAMPQLVWTAAHDGTVNYYNSQAIRYSGLHRNAEGRWIWQPILHADDRARTLEAWRTAVATDQPYECEHRVHMADGTVRWHLSRAYRAGAGDAAQWFGTATDIHDLKVAEERLREADRRKDEFLAVLAHELRNPLAPIRNGLELLRFVKSDSVAAEQARAMMARQVNHLVRLIDDLLDVSRIARGKLELARHPMDIADAVRSALETSQPLLQSAGHEVVLDLPQTPLLVEGDFVRLAQVFANLLNNAARYTPPGGKVTVNVHAEGGDVVAFIEDNGAGIPVDMLGRIFEPFFQIESKATADQGGLGVGLALARTLVELHGGSIHAGSAGAGRGSRFTVRLPAAAGRTAPAAEVRHGRPSAAPALKILVVDDNNDAAESLGLLLQLRGHEIRIANSGAAALQAAEALNPDIVLLDIGMPDMDGYQVARRLRANPGFQNVAIIALTGYGQEADRRDSAEAGFTAHLVKPVEPSTLESLFATLHVH